MTTLRALELYAGIGGFAAAAAAHASSSPVKIEVVRALDQSRRALTVYAANFDHPVRAANLAGAREEELLRARADLWWMSPPCQPFTTRGLQRDLEDPRARSFVRVLELIEKVRPRLVLLENVAGFVGSAAHEQLGARLERAGYSTRHERVLCPTELGIPNRRPRYYLVASRAPVPSPFPSAPVLPMRPLSTFLDRGDLDPTLLLDPAIAERYQGAIHVLHPDVSDACATCFTAAYGRSPVRSGSYLSVGDGRIRRFSPSEIQRLLGFPDAYVLPADLDREAAYALLGNSLSVFAVRSLLSAIVSALEMGR